MVENPYTKKECLTTNQNKTKMSKNRHIKTIQEKYGIGSVMSEVLKVIHSKNRWKEDFDKLPYLGIVYLDNEIKEIREDLIYYFEEADIITEFKELVKAKVVEVSDEYFTIVHYDNHHHDICTKRTETSKYEVIGNELKPKPIRK